MQLDRHHDKLTVRDETVVAHRDGSTVDVLEAYGKVTLQGALYVKTANIRGDSLDVCDERVFWYTVNAHGYTDEDGFHPSYLHVPRKTTLTLVGFRLSALTDS